MKELVPFKLLVFISAMFIAITAAFFSVTGIAKLFAGAPVSALIMASALELGKIVAISFLYRYWTDIGKTLKAYLLLSSAVLMIVTSAGIYGYLSSAYAAVAAEPMKMNAAVMTLDSRAGTITADVDRKTARYTQLMNLRSQQENRLDTLIGRSTTGNTSTIRSAQAQIAQYDRDMKTLQAEITQLSGVRDSILSERTVKQMEINTNAEIGTFLYIADMFGMELDTVVKWFTLVIVLVFDPLAVALIIAYNFLTKRGTVEPLPTTYQVYQDPPQAPQEANQVEPEVPEPTHTHPASKLKGIFN